MDPATTSRRRRAPLRPPEVDHAGRPLCRNCDNLIPAGRRVYCSDRCHWQYMIKHSPEFAAKMYRHIYGTRCVGCRKDESEARAAAVAAGTRFKEWPLDHIKPVADGGGSCALDNYRLLCPTCHTRITAQFNRDRAARRKESGPWKAVAREEADWRVPLPGEDR